MGGIDVSDFGHSSIRRVEMQRLFVLALLCAFAVVCRADGFSFMTVGDWGCGDDNQKSVSIAMANVAAKHNISMIVSVGDNFYDEGVSGTDDPQWQSTWANVYNAPSLQVPWFVVLGNHDHYGNPDAQIAYSKIDSRWNMPAYYFTQTWTVAGGKTLQIVFIDTIKINNYDPNQVAWVNSTLARSDADYLLVVGHFPVYSGGEHGNTYSMGRLLKPLLEANGAHYLCGHDHNLQHLRNNGIEYFVSGNGCRDDGSFRKITQTVWGSLSMGFMIHSFSADGATMTVTVYDNNSAVLYTTTVSPRADKYTKKH